MVNKKYELTDETIVVDGHTLHRIRAVRKIEVPELPNEPIYEGELGGFIEKEDNLSHDGSCWIYNDAKVYGNAKVYGDAKIWDNALVFDDAEVSEWAWLTGYVRVCGRVQVYGNAFLSDNASVCGFAKVSSKAHVYGYSEISEYAWVSDEAKVYDHAQVRGSALVYDRAQVCGNALVYCNAEVFFKSYICGGVVGEDGFIRSVNDIYTITGLVNPTTTTFYNTSKEDGKYEIRVIPKGSCFNGTLNKFESVVKSRYIGEKQREYLAAIQCVKVHFGLE